jgi:predicted acyl esterase
LARHGGILCDFLDTWYKRQVLGVQHGVGDRGSKSVVTNDPIAGPLNLTDEELRQNRLEIDTEILNREMIDDYYYARMTDFSQIDVPLLSTANWGGQGLHPRGNYEGYLLSASKQKWLEVHGDTHFTHFYSEYGEPLQKKFFSYFLKGLDSGWDKQPPVSLNIRWPGEKFVLRSENEWPIARTQWTKFYLNAENQSLSPDKNISEKILSYQTMSEGIRFITSPMAKDLEITGPLAVKLRISSDTIDADLFLVLSVYDTQGKEVVFVGSNDPRTPVGLGWLRASHRKLDPEKSTPYRPWHTHDEKQPLIPKQAEELDVEIWPTSIVVPNNSYFIKPVVNPIFFKWLYDYCFSFNVIKFYAIIQTNSPQITNNK